MRSTALTEPKEIEGSLWQAADQLRANSKRTSSEYCMPVPGVIFLRHASNRYDAALAAIQADQAVGRMPKRKLVAADFVRRRALLLPPQAHYKHLLSLPTRGNLGAALVAAKNAVEADFEPGGCAVWIRGHAQSLHHQDTQPADSETIIHFAPRILHARSPVFPWGPAAGAGTLAGSCQ
jgi:type I restriction-modification system DNA methylase subunit